MPAIESAIESLALGLGITFLGGVAAGLPIPGGTWTVAAAVAASVALLGLVSIVALRAADRPDRGQAGPGR